MTQNTALTAVLTLLAATQVHAQSSVRAYGLLDASLTWGKGASGDLATLGAGNNIASRLGFSGTEDLGNGLKASFMLEAELRNGLLLDARSHHQKGGHVYDVYYWNEIS